MGIVTSEDRIFAVQTQHRPGLYGCSLGAATSAVAPAADEERLYPFWVPSAALYDRILCEVSVVGEAGSVVRLGARLAEIESGDPSQGVLPLIDAGTVPGDGSTGQKEITISLPLSAGLVWLSVTCQICPTTRPTLRTSSTTSGVYPHGVASNSDMFTNGFWRQSPVAGALPAWSGAFTGASLGHAPKVWLRRAP